MRFYRLVLFFALFYQIYLTVPDESTFYVYKMFPLAGALVLLFDCLLIALLIAGLVQERRFNELGVCQ